MLCCRPGRGRLPPPQLSSEGELVGKPVRVTVKQLEQTTQQWEYLVEWSSGINTWTSAHGLYLRQGEDSVHGEVDGTAHHVPVDRMTEMIAVFDKLGRDKSETINFGRYGFAYRIIVRQIVTIKKLRSRDLDKSRSEKSRSEKCRSEKSTSSTLSEYRM